MRGAHNGARRVLYREERARVTSGTGRQAKPADGFALHVIEGGQRLRWTGTASVPVSAACEAGRAANQK